MRIAAASQYREISTPVSLVDTQIAEVARKAGLAARDPSVPNTSRTPRRPFVSYRALIISWAICLALTVSNLESGGLLTAEMEEPEPLALIAGLETSAAMDAVLIEACRAEYGVLPSSLTEIGLPGDDPTLEYQRGASAQASWSLAGLHERDLERTPGGADVVKLESVES